MPKISIRGTEMPASPIRKLAPLADAAKQRGIHVFHPTCLHRRWPLTPFAISTARCWSTVLARATVAIVRSWWATTRNITSI